MMDVPEDSFAILVKRSGGDQAWHRYARPLETVQPLLGQFRVRTDTCDVSQWNGELALESPEFIETFDAQVQSVAGDFWSYHWFALVAS